MRRAGLPSLIVFVTVTVLAVAGVIAAGWRPLLGLDLQGGLSVVLKPKVDTDSDKLDQAIGIIRNRVDALGVAEPDISRQGNTIVVSLPGVKDQQRALDLVGTTAELRFRPVLAQVPIGTDATTTTTAAATPTTASGDTTATTAATDASTTTTTAAPAANGAPPLTAPADDKADQPVVLAQYDNKDKTQETARFELGPALATGEGVADAQMVLNPSTGEPYVQLSFKGGETGIDAWRAAAKECYSGSSLCPTRQLAIVLDGRVLSAPTVNDDFSDSTSAQITGSFSRTDAKNLATALRYGALPVELERQQAQEVSATVGKDALHAGIVAGLLGLVIVAIYILLYYRILGAVAITSLVLSFGLMWAIISWLGASRGLALTLSGVVGIIVSIGVSIDSNIVYFEVIKDDMHTGRNLRSSAERAFRSAIRTIIRADAVSLIAAALLYWLTVGSVRGFAFYLGLATLLDLIAAYFFMRPAVLLLARTKMADDHPTWFGIPRPRVPPPPPPVGPPPGPSREPEVAVG